MRQELVDLGLQLLRQVVELGLQARAQPLSGPDQLVAERGQGGAPALAAVDQGRVEEGRPLLDQVPGVAVGHVRLIGGAGDLAGGADLPEKIQHHQHRLGLVVLAEAPDRLDLDPDHRIAP